ncbi:MAG: NUDIX hydrolase, partial [Erysipelotrichaceae bacterium]|nr:NUDIX hydrolase [Erysipelotrichaceae bacterium]
GIMPEALRAVIDYLFDVVGLNRIAACHDINNPKSGRVMEKAGMKLEGVWRSAGRNNLGICDEVWHSILRSEHQTADELKIELQDYQWPFEYTDHDRSIVRAIVFDDEGYFHFARISRDDDFGKATLIETSGGGVEPGEDLITAIKRELKEELGAEVEVIRKIGVVSDYYNLIHRHNLSNYYLCRAVSFGRNNLTDEEKEQFHLSTLKLTYQQALEEYEKNRETRIGRLFSNREVPILVRAREIIDSL